MRNLKIGTRIIIGFGSITLLLLILAFTVSVGNLQTLSDIDSINRYNVLQTAANDTMDIFNETRMSARVLYQDGSDSAYSDYSKQVLYVDNRLKVLRDTVSGDNDFSEFSAPVAQFEELFGAWRGNIEKIQAEYQSGETTGDEFSALVSETRKLDLRAREVISNIIMDVGDRAGRGLDDTASSGRNSLVITLTVSAIALITAVVLSILIVSSITKPLGRIQYVLTQMGREGDFRLSDEAAQAIAKDARGRDEVSACAAAAIMVQENLKSVDEALSTVAMGDLTAEVPLRSERDSTGNAIRQMIENLNLKFSTILDSAQQVNGSSLDLDNGFQDLVRAAEQQMTEMQELADAIVSVAEQTQTNTNMAGEAAELAETIQQNASTGSEQMNRMVNSVTEISASSRAISNIIKVIDDIAFQTNILALNAAVEAARAGQQGKGFAVVAEEVRSLASKSAEAAQNTAGLIEDSINKAQLGVEIAEMTSQSLSAIISGISQSSDIIRNISVSSKMQTEAVTQIRQGVERVTEVSRQTSNTAEQSAGASQAISGQAAVLEDLVSQFRLKEVNGAAQRRLR